MRVSLDFSMYVMVLRGLNLILNLALVENSKIFRSPSPLKACPGHHTPMPLPAPSLSSPDSRTANIFWSAMSAHIHRGQKFQKAHKKLEAQQRYLSYRAMHLAIVSQNSFVLAFVGYRTIIARYVAKWGIAQMCLCEIKYKGGYRTILGERQPPLKSIARYGVSQR